MVAILASAVTWIITYTATAKGVEKDIDNMLAETGSYEKFTEFQSYIDAYFVGDYDKEDAFEGAYAGYIQGLGDKWSYYMSAEQYASYKEDSEASYTGIGITVNYDSENKLLRVLSVGEDTPAEQAGIRPMDIITAVEGKLVADIGYDEAISMIKGEEGTSVSLTIDRSGDIIDLKTDRKQLEKQYVKYEMLDGNTGYIRITEFSDGAQDEFIAAVESLIADGAEGFVFDLRNNPGGDLTVLLSMLDRILGEEVLFTEEYKDGEKYSYDSDSTFLDYPMEVLLNEYSYSAAEYFGAVLQEYGVAEVVGQPTTGKGYGQTTFELSDGSALVISIIKYYTPKGKSLKDVGVTPDLEVELENDLLPFVGNLEIDKDSQLSAAVEELYK